MTDKSEGRAAGRPVSGAPRRRLTQSRLVVYMPTATRDDVDAYAVKEGYQLSTFVRRIIDEWLLRQEPL